MTSAARRDDAGSVSAGRPHGGCVRAVWITAVVALVGMIPAIAYVFHGRRHDRGTYASSDVELISIAGILAAPPVLALLALAWRASSARRREASEA